MFVRSLKFVIIVDFVSTYICIMYMYVAIHQKDMKTSRTQSMLQKYHQRNKHMGIISGQILGTIIKKDYEGTKTNGRKEKKIHYYPQGLISERCHRKKKKDNSSTYRCLSIGT